MDISSTEKMIARHPEAAFRCQPRIVVHHDGDSPFRISFIRMRPLLQRVESGRDRCTLLPLPWMTPALIQQQGISDDATWLCDLRKADRFGQFYLIDFEDTAFLPPTEITVEMEQRRLHKLPCGLVIYTADSMQQHGRITI